MFLYQWKKFNWGLLITALLGISTSFGEPTNKLIEATKKDVATLSSLQGVPQEDIILELQKYTTPQSEDGKTLRFKKPKGAKVVEVFHKSNFWKKGFTLTPSPTLESVVELDISDIGLKEGRNEFKFVIDGKFEEGFNRVIYIRNKKIYNPTENGARSKMYRDSKNPFLLTIVDEGAAFMELRHAHDLWKKSHKLEYKQGRWELNIKPLKLPLGKHEYKLILNGKLEGGANRFLFINKDGGIETPADNIPKVIMSESPERNLKAFAPFTDYLAIKSKHDGWMKEYPMTKEKGFWSLDTKSLNLTPGINEYKFITSDGFESGPNRILKIGAEGLVEWPKPWVPTLTTTNKAISEIIVEGPTQRSLSIKHSSDKWEKEYPLEKMGENLWSINATSLNLPLGVHEFKFIVDGVFESGSNRQIEQLNPKEVIIKSSQELERKTIYEDNLEKGTNNILRIGERTPPTSIDGDKILLQKPNSSTNIEVRLKSEDFKIGYPMTNSVDLKETLEISIDKLNLKEGVNEFKFFIEGAAEEGSNRFAYIKKGMLTNPNIQRPLILTESEGTKSIKVKSEEATTLTILHSDDKWLVPHPLKKEKDVWVAKVSELGLKGESTRYKFLIDGVYESGANRILHTDKNGNHYRKVPKIAKLRKDLSDGETLVIEDPNTSYLAIKQSDDGWTGEYPLTRDGALWKLPINTLNLKPGKYEYMIINSEGIIQGPNKTMNIAKDGTLIFPKPWKPELLKETAPSKTLKVKAPKDELVEIVHEGDGWSKIHKLAISEPLNIDGNKEAEEHTVTLEANIEELGVKEGRNKFKFLIDGQWEEGPDRLMWINKDGEVYFPQTTKSKLIASQGAVDTLRFYNKNVTSLELKSSGDKWEKSFPLTETKDYWKIDIKSLGLPAGTYDYKLIANGEWEEGSDRILNINSEIKSERLKPKRAQVNITTTPSALLKVVDPNTKYLGLRIDNDKWEKEYSFKKDKQEWVLNMLPLNLKDGKYQYKLVDTEGFEEGANRVFWVENKKVYLKEPRSPEVEKIDNDTSILKVVAPNASSLSIKTDNDKWEKEIPLTEGKAPQTTWTISTKDLNLKEGIYEYKLIINGEFEKGPNRKLAVDKNGAFTSLDAESEAETSSPGILRIRAPKAIRIGLKHSLDWGKEFELEKDKIGDWVIELDKLGIPTNQRFFFKLLINKEWEEGPNRVGFINNKNEIVIESVKENTGENIRKEDLTKSNDYFGMVLPIAPDPTLSLLSEEDWYQKSRIYHIWIPSYRDSKEGSLAKDGIGDLKGIKELIEAGYFDKLGINAIWLSPIFRSAEEDYPSESMHGYDTSNFYEINKNYGSLDDFKTLLDVAHKKGIRIICEYVPNHVSDKHPWFLASRDKNHPNHKKYKDWFVWSKNKKPPFLNSWQNHDGWHKDEVRQEYYYGLFGSGMPDLNYENPELRNEMMNVILYWFNIGVDGLRVDANKYLYEDFDNPNEGMKDNPKTITFYNKAQEIINEYSALGYKKVLIAENWTKEKDEIEIYGKTEIGHGFELSLDFVFPESLQSAIVAEQAQPLKTHILEGYPKNIDYVRFLSNHDNHEPRAKTAFGQASKLAAAANILLPGPYIIYYGEERGMTATKGRPENMRAKMVWDEKQADMELLNWYIKLNNIRKQNQELISRKNMRVISLPTDNYLGLEFKNKIKSLTVILNLSKEAIKVNLENNKTNKQKLNTLVSQNPPTLKNGSITIDVAPYSCEVIEQE